MNPNIISSQLRTSAQLSLILLVVGCQWFKGRHIVDGGPCTYDIKFFPAEVIAIPEIDSGIYDVHFVLKRQIDYVEIRDTLYYSAQFGKLTTPEIMAKEGVTIGALFKYEVRDIETGSCTPHMEWLLMEKYKP
jgi:hypothetical protein